LRSGGVENDATRAEEEHAMMSLASLWQKNSNIDVNIENIEQLRGSLF
jgi:hypothetical protein